MLWVRIGVLVCVVFGLIALDLGQTAISVSALLSQPDSVIDAHISAGMIKVPHEVYRALDAAAIRFTPPALADLDHDQYLEITVGTDDGVVYAIKPNDKDGTLLWSVDTSNAVNLVAANSSETTIRAAMVVADLDNDGWNEVVVPIGTVSEDRQNGGILVLTHDGHVAQGWPQLTYDKYTDGYTDGFVSGPTVVDLDNDGDLEIIAGALDNRVYVWHHDGAWVDGWPRFVYDTIWSSPVAGDLDGDGLMEIVVAVDAHQDSYFGSIDGGALYVFKSDGTTLTNFPRYINENFESTPVLADLNKDGYLDIIVGGGSYWGGDDGHKVHVWNRYGNYLPGWPVVTGDNVSGSPAVADIDKDGSLEVVVGSWDRKVYAWRYNGAPVAGWPMYPKQWWYGTTAAKHSPILVNINGTGADAGKLEMLINNGWEITVVDSAGKQLTWDGTTDNPNLLPSYFTNYTLDASPAVGDIDNDGRLELVAGGATSNGVKAAIYVWELSSSAANAADGDWPMYKRDVARSGLLESQKVNGGVVVEHDLPTHLLPGERFVARVTLRNTGTATWRSSLGYRLGGNNTAFNLPTRFDMPQDVSPGSETTFEFELQAPTQEGFYPLSLRMLQESDKWFGPKVVVNVRVGNQPAFYVLHKASNGVGGVVPEGLAQTISPPTENFWHAAKSFALTRDGAGYFLLVDGYSGAPGHVTWAGTAPDVGSVGTPQIMDIVLSPDGVGYYVVDAYGNISFPSSAVEISPRPATFGDQRIRSLAVVSAPHIGVYLLDKNGNIYPGGGVSTLTPATPIFSDPIARKIKVTASGLGYYVLDAYGRVHRGGNAPAITANYTPHIGEDWALDFELTDDERGYYLLDKDGNIHTGGTAIEYPDRNPIADSMGEPLDLEIYDSRIRSGPQFSLFVGNDLIWLAELGAAQLPLISFEARNVGAGGALSWSATVTEGATWLAVTPDHGSTPETVTLHAQELPGLGTYQGSVVFTCDGQDDIEITVHLIVVEELYHAYMPLVMR